VHLTRALLFTFVTACTYEHHSVTEEVQYRWDGAPVVCSKVVDDVAHGDGLTKVGIDLNYAKAHDTAAVLHAHAPMSTVSYEQLDCIFDLATDRDIELVTFSDFIGRSSPHPALALSFDDEAIDAWYAARNLFAKWNAHVTFFVAGYENFTSDQRTKLAELAALGHDIEAHGMYHLNAIDYVAAHGIDDYLQLEVLPYIALLEAAGYPITTYAFPYGASTDEITDAVLEYVPQVRVTRSACPY
jgi:peptidoglycan/xylan/chitin deacetylase (PgdA/CDA1 family)